MEYKTKDVYKIYVPKNEYDTSMRFNHNSHNSSCYYNNSQRCPNKSCTKSSNGYCIFGLTGNPIQDSNNQILTTIVNQGRTVNPVFGAAGNQGRTVNPVFDAAGNQGRTVNPVFDAAGNQGRTVNPVFDAAGNQGRTVNPVFGATPIFNRPYVNVFGAK